MPRAYICNVIYTLVGETFKKWVNKECLARNEQFTKKQGMEIKLQSRIAEAAAASTAINRKSVFLNKVTTIFFLNCRVQRHWCAPHEAWK